VGGKRQVLEEENTNWKRLNPFNYYYFFNIYIYLPFIIIEGINKSNITPNYHHHPYNIPQNIIN